MTENPKSKRPAAVKALIGIQAFFALSGFASGFYLFLSPSGKAMGVSHLLEDMPVGDFTLVGLFFIAFYGVLPSLAAYGLWTKKRWPWTDAINRWTGQLWAWTVSAAVGLTLFVWIAVEIYFLGFLTGSGGVLQIAMTALGIVILALNMLPSVRQDMRLAE